MWIGIDRKLYDHLNSYTGEKGSDGVVRAAAANLNFGLVELKQRGLALGVTRKSGLWLALSGFCRGCRTAGRRWEFFRALRA